MVSEITNMSQSLDRLSTDFGKFITKAMALIEQQTLLADFYAMASETQPFVDALHLSDTEAGGALLARRQRSDAVLSQALGGFATSFHAAVLRWFRLRRKVDSTAPEQHFEDQLFWESLIRVGFLMQIESLLSAQGDEKAMLEDTFSALNDTAEHVCFGVHELKSDKVRDDVDLNMESLESALVHVYGPRHNLVVSIGLPSAIFQTAPKSLRQRQATIPIVPVVFSQGVNEQQVFANFSGDSKRQDAINEASLHRLEEFILRWKSFLKEKAISALEHGDGQVQYNFPTDLVSLVDSLMFDIRSVLHADTSGNRPLSQSLPTEAELSRRSDALGATKVPSLTTLTPLSSSPSPSITGVLAAAAKPLKSSKLKNQTALLLLTSHLTRALANTNPQSPSVGCTSMYELRNDLNWIPQPTDLKEPMASFVIQMYPTTPVAARLTCCKSAKDRTGMSVTLEQAFCARYRGMNPPMRDVITGFDVEGKSAMDWLHEAMQVNQKISTGLERASSSSAQQPRARFMTAESGTSRSSAPDSTMLPLSHHQHACLHPDYFVRLLMAMRGEQGVRLENVERNLNLGRWSYIIKSGEPTTVGVDVPEGRRGAAGKYAFNSFQWTVLPMLYRPPMRCIQGGLMT